jgi:hypothetical protein
MNLDTLLAICSAALLVICRLVMWYCEKNVYLKYNKTGNACPAKKAKAR